MKHLGIQYLKDVWNYPDLIAFPLNIGIIILHILDMCGLKSLDRKSETLANLAVLAVTLVWLKLFYWMKLFESTSKFVTLIMETMYDIRIFICIVFGFLMMFGNAIYIYNSIRDGENQLATNVFGTGILSLGFNQYLLALGEFDMDNFNEGGNTKELWFLFVCATFFSQIMILNMLVGIMGETLGKVNEKAEQAALSQQINILDDFAFLFLELPKQFEILQTIFKVDPPQKFVFKASLLNIKQEITLEKKIDSIEDVVDMKL